VLTPLKEAAIVAFRQQTLLPLDDVLFALQPQISQLTRSSLHRLLERHGISDLPKHDSQKAEKKRFKAYPIGYFHIDICEVRREERKLFLCAAVDRSGSVNTRSGRGIHGDEAGPPSASSSILPDEASQGERQRMLDPSSYRCSSSASSNHSLRQWIPLRSPASVRFLVLKLMVWGRNGLAFWSLESEESLKLEGKAIYHQGLSP
jgi:hypothetical protein